MDFAPKLATKHSRIVQRTISSPMRAVKEFDNVKNGEVPVVLIPKWPTFFSLMLNVPSGVFVLWQRWHQRKGHLPAGLIPFWPAWNRISHIVTKASKTYNAPVQNCPTKDNVMVAVDVSLMFQIQDPEKFVYELGAHRFDEYLSAQTDEAIRGLVFEVPAMRVHDLREEFAMGMKSGLNRKINKFGVVIQNVKITNVALPVDLDRTLQNTTSFKTMIEQQEMAHAASMRVLLDTALQKLTEIKRQNERDAQDLKAAKDRALINRENQRIEAQTARDVAIVEAETKAAVALTLAESNKENAKNEALKHRVALVEKTRAACEAEKTQVNQRLLNVKVKENAKLKAAEATAKGILADANVEGIAAESLREVRKYEVEMERMQILQGIAAKSKMVVGGTTGEAMLQSLCPGSKYDKSI